MEDATGNVNEQGSIDQSRGQGHKPTKLLDRTREILRLKHYSIRTEQAHIGWMTRYLLFHNKSHPKEMGPAEIEASLFSPGPCRPAFLSVSTSAARVSEGFCLRAWRAGGC